MPSQGGQVEKCIGASLDAGSGYRA
jgi:hypothetical protein